MSNHVHLLISPHKQGSIGAMLQDLGRRYVRVLNNLHGRSGTLWEGRFRSSLIDSERYLLACHRYIELNPVRAGLVEEPAAYAWSSHRHYVGDQRNPLITEHEAYRTLGTTDDERRATFRSLFAELLEERLLTEIRDAINTDSAFGSPTFMDDVEAKLGRSVRPPVRGRPRKVVTGKLL
jgi:putative transposase